MQKNKNIKILIACHKEDPNIRQDDIYMPIHVGKALHPELDLGFQGDNTGDNISEKNPYYCELTALYWAWKNLKGVDYIGLCHYRRYFKLKKSILNIIFKKNNYTKFNIKKIYELANYNKVIVPKEIVLPESVFNDYAINHNGLDLKKMIEIINKKYPNFTKIGKVLYDSNKLSGYNMFLMPWKLFDEYCKFLFETLFELEKQININDYDNYQKRIFGFLGERLLNIFIAEKAESKDILKFPVIFFSNYKKRFLNLKSFLNKFRYNLSYNISK